MTTSIRVLFLEDNAHDAELMLHELRRVNLDVSWERVDTEQAFLAQLETHPDIILADYTLPAFDALSALHILQKRSLDIPFMIVSGTIDEEVAVDAIKQGAADYMLKDRLARLGPAVERALDLKRLRDEKRRSDEALQASEYRFRALIENSSDAIALADAEGTILYASPAAGAILGVMPDRLIGKSTFDAIHPDDLERAKSTFDHVRRSPGVRLAGQYRLRHKDGSWRWVEGVGSNMLQVPGVHAMVANYRDISERKRTEEAVRLQSAALNAAANAIMLTTRDGTIEWINQAFTTVTGYTFEEAIGRNPRELVNSGKQDSAYFKDLWDTIVAGKTWHGELVNRRKDGSLYTEEETITPLQSADGSISHFISIKHDVTERKRAEQALRESEERYRLLVKTLPDGVIVHSQGRIVFANPASATIIGAASPADLSGMPVMEFVHPNYREMVLTRIQHSLSEGLPIPVAEEKFVRLDGTPIDVEVSAIPFSYAGTSAVLTVFNDITERKRAEEAVRQSEARYRALVEQAADGIFISDAQGRYLDVNTSGCAMLGYSHAEILGMDYTDVLLPADLAQDPPKLDVLIAGQTLIRERIYKRKDGTVFPVEISAKMLSDGRIQNIVRDITARKQAEAQIRQHLAELQVINRISTALRTAQTLDEMLPLLLDETLAVFHTTAGSLWLYEPAGAQLRRMAARGWVEGMVEVQQPGEGVVGHVFSTGEPYLTQDISADAHTHEASRPAVPHDWAGLVVPLRVETETIGTLSVTIPAPRAFSASDAGLLSTIAEIAGSTIHRMKLYQQTELRLQRLMAMRDADQAILNSMDLRVTLSVLLGQITDQLKVEAAAVLLFNPNGQRLEYAAGLGFRGKGIERSRLRLGEGHAGLAALERRTVHVPNIRQAADVDSRTHLIASDDFVSYYGVPLLAKGQLKGVLDIFLRAPLMRDPEWLEFLETFAGQVAIAIDTSQLFEGLERSNLNLTLAYDTTLEGWSRALDLRDKETEGHTQRVTEMTMRLASAMGVGEAAFEHMRRGALLHDIGKMGVPDSILLKPAPLTDDEWAIMRKHPAYAYELLAPIEYLRPALDIPYCHHEKWDGTGYPRGLKGEQIPFSARIFAVVDVWDALRSDRPYRAGWPEGKVRKHIQSLAGTHFDPQIVEVFLATVKPG